VNPCPACGADVARPEPLRGRPPTYCNATCRDRARRARDRAEIAALRERLAALISSGVGDLVARAENGDAFRLSDATVTPSGLGVVGWES
jgi:hypothetical protein